MQFMMDGIRDWMTVYCIRVNGVLDFGVTGLVFGSYV